MQNITRHIVNKSHSVKDVLQKLDQLASDAILFVVDEQQQLVGSITDGDIRRGLIKGFNLEAPILNFLQPNPKFFRNGSFDLDQMQNWRKNNYRIIPVVDQNNCIVDIVNFRKQQSYLPIDAVIMAGGKGVRLLPFTENTPKPLLKIGDKPIVEYNVDRLKLFGIRNLTFTIKYLGQQIKDYFGNGSLRDMKIEYIEEETPLGTIGAVSMMEDIHNDYILVMNSDLLTNIDYEDMFRKLLAEKGEMIVATTPYEVKIPYGVIEVEGEQIVDLKEKPTYTYYSNAGIYIFKKQHIALIPKQSHFNATDLMEALYTSGLKVLHYPILGYWLDIGKPHDFEKAQHDVKHIKF